jgi:hypothetical protein
VRGKCLYTYPRIGILVWGLKHILQCCRYVMQSYLVLQRLWLNLARARSRSRLSVEPSEPHASKETSHVKPSRDNTSPCCLVISMSSLLNFNSANLQMSFPPPTTNGSAATDLAVFMHSSTPWDTEWYTFNPPTPPQRDLHLMLIQPLGHTRRGPLLRHS